MTKKKAKTNPDLRKMMAEALPIPNVRIEASGNSSVSNVSVGETQVLPVVKYTGRVNCGPAERNTPIAPTDIPRLSVWQMILGYFKL